MSFLNKITPPFLREFDAYLRVNHPWIWTTKIHLHIYLALLLGILFSLIGLVYIADIKDVPSRHDVNGLFYLLFVPAALFSLLMLYNMALFNTDKSAGYRFRYQEFFQFLIYFITFCLPLLIIVPPALILNERIQKLVSNEQFQLDKKHFNEGEMFFPHLNSYHYHYYPSDAIYLEETTPKRNPNQTEYGYEDEVIDVDFESDYVPRPSDEEDSIRREMLSHWERMGDSIFWHRGVFKHKRPKLYFQRERLWNRGAYYDPFELGGETLEQKRTRDSLFRLYLNHVNITRDPQIAAKNISEVSKLLKRYYKDTFIDEKEILSDFININYGEEGFNKLFLDKAFSKTEVNIDNIQDAKLKRADVYESGLYFGLGIFIFCLSILFYIFKNVHWRQFLLAVFLSALIMTFISIIEIIFRSRGGFINLMGILLPLIFLACSIRGFYIKRFSWILNQMNIMLNVVLPFLPLIILLFLDEYFHIFTIAYFDKFKEYYIDVHGERQWRYSEAYHNLVSTIWMATFWAGILSYVFIWNSYLKALYLRYWFLPKTK